MLTPADIINKLRPCHYKYNEKMPLGEKINFGFLAQDILETFGEDYNFVVKDQKDEYYKVNYYQFIGPLVGVLQEQQKDIELLKEEIKKLQAKAIL